jgi:hypothetical protein
MREIVSEAIGSDAVTYLFDDGSVVWVCFKATTVVDASSCATARDVALRFLNTLNPASRWEGKIDGEGNVLESPIDL